MTFQPARFIPSGCYQSEACALTARFHPYPDASAVAVSFSATLSVPSRQVGKTPPVRWRGALRCPDFPRLSWVVAKGGCATKSAME